MLASCRENLNHYVAKRVDNTRVAKSCPCCLYKYQIDTLEPGPRFHFPLGVVVSPSYGCIKPCMDVVYEENEKKIHLYALICIENYDQSKFAF